MVNINIPLPTSCASCPLSVRHFGKLYCPPLDGRVGNEGKDERCPLVDAEGRDDLISRADALSCFHDWIDQRGDVHTADEMQEYRDIEALPSAEPERKWGKWNTYYHSDIDFSHSCNQCGYSAPYQMIGGEVFQKKWNFCPNCGCRMVKEGDKHD